MAQENPDYIHDFRGDVVNITYTPSPAQADITIDFGVLLESNDIDLSYLRSVVSTAGYDVDDYLTQTLPIEKAPIGTNKLTSLEIFSISNVASLTADINIITSFNGYFTADEGKNWYALEWNSFEAQEASIDTSTLSSGATVKMATSYNVSIGVSVVCKMLGGLYQFSETLAQIQLGELPFDGVAVSTIQLVSGTDFTMVAITGTFSGVLGLILGGGIGIVLERRKPKQPTLPQQPPYQPPPPPNYYAQPPSHPP